MESSKKGTDNHEELSQSRNKGLLRRDIVLEEKSPKQAKSKCHEKQTNLQLDESKDDRVPLPPMYIALPGKSPTQNESSPTRNAFTKEKIFTSSNDENFRALLVNDILKKMEYTPKEGDEAEEVVEEREGSDFAPQDVSGERLESLIEERFSRGFEKGSQKKGRTALLTQSNGTKRSGGLTGSSLSSKLERSGQKYRDKVSTSRDGKSRKPDRFTEMDIRNGTDDDNSKASRDTAVNVSTNAQKNDSKPSERNTNHLISYNLKEAQRSINMLKLESVRSPVRTDESRTRNGHNSRVVSPKTLDLSGISKCSQNSKFDKSMGNYKVNGKIEGSFERSERSRDKLHERSLERSCERSRFNESSNRSLEKPNGSSFERSTLFERSDGGLKYSQLEGGSKNSLERSNRDQSPSQLARNSSRFPRNSNVTNQRASDILKRNSEENFNGDQSLLTRNFNSPKMSQFSKSTTNSPAIDSLLNHDSPRFNQPVTFHVTQDSSTTFNSGRMRPRDLGVNTGSSTTMSSLYDRFARSLTNGVSKPDTKDGMAFLTDPDSSYNSATKRIKHSMHEKQFNRDADKGWNESKTGWSGSFMEDSLAISNKDTTSNELKARTFKDICRPIPLPLRRHLSIGLYAIQVADIQCNDIEDSKQYTELVIKARAYRKWCIMFRLRKFMRDEEKSKMHRAYEHWKLKSVKKCFSAIRTMIDKKHNKAVEWHRILTLEKVFKALVAMTVSRKQLLNDHLAMRKGKMLASAWVKWTSAVNENRKDKMRTVFSRWKEKHLEVKRELLLERYAERQATSKVYYKWKMTYTVEQQCSISNLHFKIVLLSKTWQIWRVYTAERRVKNRMKNMARIHYDQHSLYKVFYHWKETVRKSLKVTKQIDKRLIGRVFYSWKNWAAYSKVLGQRQMSACKEYHNRCLLRSSMEKWRIELKLKIFVSASNEKHLRRTFQLWRLRLKRKILHRKLCRAQGRKARQSRCFLAWLECTREAKERREKFVQIFVKSNLKSCFERWREFTKKSIELGKSNGALVDYKSRKSLKDAFTQWKLSLKILYFSKRVAIARTERIVRSAAALWRTKVKKGKLNQKLSSSNPLFEFLRLKGAFKLWLHEKRQAEKDRQRADVVASILNGGCVSRVFAAWRIVTQEDRVIHHMVERMHRRNTARVFDAWRLVVTRKKVSIQYRRLKEVGKLQEFFDKWSSRFRRIQNERQISQAIQDKILLNCVTVWKGHVNELKSRRLAAVKRCFNQWREKVKDIIETRDEERGRMARQLVIMKLKFGIWMDHTANLREKRLAIEDEAKKFHLEKLRRRAMKRWRRQFQAHCIVYEYAEEKRIECLDNAFQTWKDFIKEQLQHAVERFTDRLEREPSPRGILRQHTLSESFGSGNFPPLRSSSGYFGSLPNISRAMSPLPISPLADPRSIDHRRGSPASLSPEHALTNSRNGADCYTSSPIDDPKRIIYDRSRSLNDRPKSPTSLRSNGTLSSKERVPFAVPPLFTDVSQLQEEEFVELTRPHSLSLARSEVNRKTQSLPKDRSVDDYVSPFPFSHSSEEDAMSYYSFQSESAGGNREVFISSTIRHWRRLPLSITFKAWLKFTQQQRIRRELLQHFINYTCAYNLKRSFYGWHRKLYCRLASQRFLRTKLLGKYFKAISTHKEMQKSKKDKTLVAELHLKNTRIETKFRLWRRRFLARRRLQSLVGKWQQAIHVTGSQRSACERFVKERDSKSLKEAFVIWKESLYKNEVADNFSKELVLKRIVRKWKNVTCKFGSLHKKSDLIIRNRTAKVFIEWKICLERKRIADAHYQDSQQEYRRKLFIAWLARSKKKKMLCATAVKFQRKLNFKIIVQAFFIWSEETTRYKMADDHHRESLMIRVLESWHELSEQRSDLRTRQFDFQRYTAKVKMRDVFYWWKRSAICSKVYKERKKIEEEKLLRDVFVKWSTEIIQKKWENHLRMTIQRKAFVCWFRRTVHNKRRRTLAKIAAKKWITFTRGCIQLKEMLNDLLLSRQKISLHNTFLEWREAANGQKMARFHYEYQLAITSIKRWSAASTNMKNLRRKQIIVEEIVEYNYLSSAFGVWSALFKRFQRNAMVLENYLELRQQEHLKICIHNLRLNALKARAERYQRFRLQRMAFQQWRNVTKRSKSLAVVKDRLLRISLLKIANHWRQTTKDQIAREKVADKSARKKEMKQMKKVFSMWLLKTRGRMLARLCFESHLVKRSFKQWQMSTKGKVVRRNVLEEFKTKKNKEKLSENFKFWKKLASDSKRTKKLEEIHVQIADAHYREKILEKFFCDWRNDNKIEKFRRKNSTKILQTYFINWKQSTLGTNQAEQMYEQNLLEKGWRQWRLLKIKRGVIRAMQEHETKKQLSEVFSSWYNYTYIRRHAIREIEFRKKQKIFRKWMQEYNKA